MSSQNYSNHRYYYITHHLIFYPVAGLLMALGLYYGISSSENRILWLLISALSACVIWLSYMLRQHYALGNQNRIVRLEMRVRYFTLTGKRFEEMENQLSFGQIAALRFASDEELLPLITRTLDEQLTSDAIKRSVKNWNPDYMRV
jgi:hypothetical protein